MIAGILFSGWVDFVMILVGISGFILIVFGGDIARLFRRMKP